MMGLTKKVVVITGIILFLLILISPAPSGLAPQGKNALAVFILCVTLWMTNVIPFAITGLIAIVSIPLLRIAPSKVSFAYFGNSAVFFVLGAFILATAMMKTGLSKRIAVIFLKKFDRNVTTLSFGIMLTAFLMAFWMPEHAVAALLFPIVLEITHSLQLKPMQSMLGKNLFFALARGTVIGGVCTLLGGARNPLAIEMLHENYQLSISFLDWMIAIVPLGVILMILGFLVNRFLFVPENISLEQARVSLEASIQKMGPISNVEKKVGLIAVLTIFSWIFLNKYLELPIIALLSAISLFVIRTIKWKDIENYINWGIILMYGGAVSLGATLSETGTMDWLTQQLFHYFSFTPMTMIIFMIILAIALTEVISNVAAVVTLLPMSFALANTLHVNPVLMVFVIAVPSGLAFCLPIGTPPNAIAFSSGYFEISDSIKSGLIMNALTIILILCCIKFYWSYIGFPIN